MTELKIYCLEDQAESNIITTLGEGEYTIGRGDILKCNDKRVSRNHAEIIVNKTEVILKSTHINPSFYKAANGKSIQLLKKDDSVPLNDGDQFALLADKFWFKVKRGLVDSSSTYSLTSNQSLKRSVNAEKKDESCKRFKNTSYDESTIKTSKIEGLDSFLNTIVPGNVNGTEIDTDSLLNKLANITKEDYGHINVSKDIDSSDINESIDLAVSVSENSMIPKKNVSAEDEFILSINNLHKSTENDTINEDNLPSKQDPSVSSPTSYTEQNKPSDETTLKNSKEEIVVNVRNDISDDSDGSMDLAAPTEPEKAFWGAAKPGVRSSKEEEAVGSEDDEISTTMNIPSSSNVASSSNDAKPKARRDRCWYAETCYRKNPSHRAEYSHPDDDDFDSDPTDDRPQCQYGSACYRKNADHRKEYKHSRQPVAKQQTKKIKNGNQSDEDGVSSDSEPDSTNDNEKPKKRKAAKKVKKYQETPEDDYDMEDPFINDGSSDDFQPSNDGSDDDTDWEDSQKVVEESEETRRLLKEAKKFTKVKKN
ncbi:unnamed protein product [Phaedon cochleariae]|uniref:FHA domain-containing protein n=1 Tax=Phaedon cochleariae TaxID=80249 RepID=A0A9N9SI55_PHACE|nr:unnamed protein product [Phaedon cochleariae]